MDEEKQIVNRKPKNHAQRNKKTGVAVCISFCHICHIFVFCILHSSCNQCLRHMTYKPQTQISAIYCIFGKYMCDMCVWYLYCVPFLGIQANVSPPSGFAMLTATLSFLKFYIIFFLIFFIFIFFILFIALCIDITLNLHSILPHNRTNVLLCTISHTR